ncbi:MAG: hypothetical protein CL908_25820 [Deltaproteobacteria bacterium]|nr:hypothetical protein [Deltaproteobacteria bacterium]
MFPTTSWTLIAGVVLAVMTTVVTLGTASPDQAAGARPAPGAGPRALSTPSSADYKAGVTAWTQFRGDLLNTGISHSRQPNWKKLGIKWKYWTGSYQSSTPAMADGKLVTCTEGGDMHCVDARTGKKVWKILCSADRKPGRGIVFCSPLIHNGRVYVGNKIGQLWCINFKTGKKEWTWQEDGLDPRIFSSPKGDDRGIVIATVDQKMMRGQITCLDPVTGKERWKTRLGREVGATPAVLGDALYVACKDRKLYEIGYADGKIRRAMPLPGTTHCTPALGMGFAFLVTGGRKSVAVDLLQGKVAWQADATSDDKIAVGFANGRAYFPLGRFLYCFDAITGAEKYKFPTGHKVSAPCISGDYALITGRDGWFRVIDKAGEEVHSVNLGEPCVAGPILVDGVVYTCSDVNVGHHLFALGEMP